MKKIKNLVPLLRYSGSLLGGVVCYIVAVELSQIGDWYGNWNGIYHLYSNGHFASLRSTLAEIATLFGGALVVLCWICLTMAIITSYTWCYGKKDNNDKNSDYELNPVKDSAYLILFCIPIVIFIVLSRHSTNTHVGEALIELFYVVINWKATLFAITALYIAHTQRNKKKHLSE